MSRNFVSLIRSLMAVLHHSPCYAMLNHLNSLDRNTITIEDPVEYRLPLAHQIQVNHDIGLDFPRVFRSVLRQDPDSILVGEIRDAETARIAAEAALTGHLVLATLHTNDAVQAVVRFQEMGTPPHMVAPALLGIVAQRLARQICVHCSEPYSPDESERALLPPGETREQVQLFRGHGCPHCANTGYFGRVGIHEAVLVSSEVRELILENASVSRIARTARGQGYRSMRHDGLKKALMGLTTLSEIRRVTPGVS